VEMGKEGGTFVTRITGGDDHRKIVSLRLTVGKKTIVVLWKARARLQELLEGTLNAPSSPDMLLRFATCELLKDAEYFSAKHSTRNCQLVSRGDR
jgi:hypothetical protein